MRLPLLLRVTAAVAVLIHGSAVEAQGLPALSDSMLKDTGAALHVDVQTGRMVGVTSSGPVAEAGAKIVEVLFGDHTVGEWIGYLLRTEGEYVKPAVSQRLILLRRDGRREPLLDAEFSPSARDALTAQLTDYRRKVEALTGEMHVPDYLLRSANNAILHVEITRSVPFDRGRGNLSATHTATVLNAVQGEFRPGQTVEFIEESRRKKRYDPPADPQRIVLLTYSRSVQDGQMKWWLHDRVNYGYSEAGLRTLRSDSARVRAAQAEKAAGR